MANRFQTIYASQETGRWAVFDHQYDLGIIGIVYEQDIPASTWNFIHNLNKNPFLLQFFRNEDNGTKTEIKPSMISIDLNSITVTLGVPVVGSIVVVFANPAN